MLASNRTFLPMNPSDRAPFKKGPPVKPPQLRSTQFRALLASIAMSLAMITAAQETVVIHYQLQELTTEPGTISLSPNYLTLMEFPDLVQSVATGRSDLIQVEVDDNRILLRPTRSNGRTDLIVRISGTNALFRIEIDPDNGTPRRYVIHPNTPPARGAVSSGGGGGAVEVSSMPITTAEVGGMPTAQGPAVPLPFAFTYSARVNENRLLTIYYSLSNRSSNPIANEGTRLRILDELGTVGYSIVRMNANATANNRIQPGASEHGVITLERAILGVPRIEWPIIEQGPGRTYIINELVVQIDHD
jgi:hypothetical protein